MFGFKIFRFKYAVLNQMGHLNLIYNELKIN